MTATDILKQKNGSIDYDAYKGLEGTVDVNGMSVDVVITDARTCYGRFDLCVEPKSGHGFRWIDHRNVELKSRPTSTVVNSLSFTDALKAVREAIPSISKGTQS